MKQQSYAGRMMKDVFKQWNWYLASVLATAGYLLVDLFVRSVSGRVTDAVISGSSRFVPLLAVMLLAFLAESPFHGLSTYTKAMMSQRVMTDLRIRMGEKVFAISLPALAGERTGDLISRIGSEMESLDNFLYYGLSFVTTLVVQGIASFAILLATDWQLSLVLLAGAAICIPISYRMSSSIRRRELAVRAALGRAAQSAQQGFGALELVKSFAAEKAVKAQYRQAVDEAAGQEAGIVHLSARIDSAGQMLGLLPLALMLILGAFRIQAGTLTPGELMSLTMVGSAFFGFLRDAPDNIIYLRTSLVACQRVYGFLDLPDEQAGSQRRLPEDTEQGIAFEDVSFSYGDRPALENVDLVLPKGGKVALVGSSGSGKSTMIRLICGFLTAGEGTVSLFGLDTGSWDLSAMRRNIAVVFQESYLFPGTLRENLLCAKADASDEELLEACRRAGIDQRLLSRGLDAQAGERGNLLSGGERQRIAIARAFLKDAPLLLMDEPTSSLDTESERQVLESLRELMKGRTVLLSTHRLSLAKEADLIVVLEHGRIVQQGSHARLMEEQNGIYARMVREQTFLEEAAQ